MAANVVVIEVVEGQKVDEEARVAIAAKVAADDRWCRRRMRSTSPVACR